MWRGLMIKFVCNRLSCWAPQYFWLLLSMFLGMNNKHAMSNYPPPNLPVESHPNWRPEWNKDVTTSCFIWTLAWLSWAVSLAFACLWIQMETDASWSQVCWLLGFDNNLWFSWLSCFWIVIGTTTILGSSLMIVGLLEILSFLHTSQFQVGIRLTHTILVSRPFQKWSFY